MPRSLLGKPLLFLHRSHRQLMRGQGTLVCPISMTASLKVIMAGTVMTLGMVLGKVE